MGWRIPNLLWAFALVAGIPASTAATPFTIQYEGVASAGSPSLFVGSTITGFITYDTDTPAIPRPGGGIGFALIDYGFVIDFVSRGDYISTGIVDSGLGNITVPGSGPRVDLLVQGVFEGPNLSLSSRPTGSTFQIQDGFNLANPANVLVADTLPNTPFDLADVTAAHIFLEWTNDLGGRTLADFSLTSMTVGPQATVPEPTSLLLFSAGGAALLLARAVRRRESRHRSENRPG